MDNLDVNLPSTMSSSSSTASETLHEQSTKVEELEDVEIKSRKQILFQMLHSYIGDLRCSWSQRERLTMLVENIEKQWTNILADKGLQPKTRISAEAQFRTVSQPTYPKDPLSQLANDLVTSFALSEDTKCLDLRGIYTFTCSLGHKAPIKKIISAEIRVSARPEVVLIAFPGKRTQAVDVGYCAQYDSGVFFAKDGKIYLVDSEQLKKFPPEDNGRKIYEADEVLDSNWQSFAIDDLMCKDSVWREM